jgi:predicted O-methyltransferase YrrM
VGCRVTIAEFYHVTASQDRATIVHRGRDSLPALFQALGFTHGAEVGVWAGGFSQRLCRGVPGLSLLCVDPWEPSPDYDEPKNNAEKLSLAEQAARERLAQYVCKIMKSPSQDAARAVRPQSLDFVYLDANHDESHVEADLSAWTGRIRPGGVLAGHDYAEIHERPFIQVKPAVDRFVSEQHIKPWFLLAKDKIPSYLWAVA